jgi:hypothetical protein
MGELSELQFPFIFNSCSWQYITQQQSLKMTYILHVLLSQQLQTLLSKLNSSSILNTLNEVYFRYVHTDKSFTKEPVQTHDTFSEILLNFPIQTGVFWEVTPCSLVCKYQCFTGIHCFHHGKWVGWECGHFIMAHAELLTTIWLRC